MNGRPLPFTLRQLQYAVAVAETLNFRKAATHCAVSQPSLSAQIAELESSLGLRLFERDRRRVLVTAGGQPILERARALLRQAEDLVELARRGADPLQGTLRIGVLPTISPYLLPRLTPALRRAHPRLTALWTEERTAPISRSLQAGALDAALVALEAELGEVEHEVIGRDTFLLVTGGDHPLGRGQEPVEAAELHDQDMLLLDEGHCFRDQALAFCTSARAHELEFRATSLPTLAQVVASGAGVTLLPEMAVPVETERAELRVRRFADPPPGRTIVLAWRKGSPLGPALGRLARTIREVFAKQPG